MSEAADGRACPACGRFVTTGYCPHCGARVIFDGPPAAPFAGAPFPGAPSDDFPTVPSMPAVGRADGPVAAVPEMFPTEMVPAAPQAWSQAPEPGVGPQTGLFPGWTGMYPAVATQGAAGALAPRPERRRKAILAVVGIAAVTVIVLVAALLITPHLGKSGNDANKDGQPVVVSSADRSPSTAASSAPSSSPASSAASSVPVAPVVPSPAKTTVTVTAPATPTGAARTTVPAKPAPATSAVKPTPKPVPPKTTAKPKPTATPTPTPAPVANPLGVPEREITCNSGFVVQLASELDAAAFTAHVNRLKAAGQLPAGSLAANSAKSCKIFTSQVNTLVLYSGPYAGPYDGCGARLTGPADAYIKGSNPGSSQQYISCLCAVSAPNVPQYSVVGQQGVWVGEAQRVLGNRLNIDVSDLSNHWGTFTAGTKAAVQQFQTSAKLPASGNLDHATWKALQAAEC